MGFYIETGKALGKAEDIIRLHGAIEIEQPKSLFALAQSSPGQALICVVSNGYFEAAGYCFNEHEFQAFTDPNDHRPKRWLLMDKALACKLTGYKL